MGEIADACDHGLSIAFCNLCRDHPSEARVQHQHSEEWGQAAKPNLPRGPRTRASFEGKCAFGGEVILIGEWIFLRDEEWGCLSCTRDIDKRSRHGG